MKIAGNLPGLFYFSSAGGKPGSPNSSAAARDRQPKRDVIFKPAAQK
jgi:hypothetical protein